MNNGWREWWDNVGTHQERGSAWLMVASAFGVMSGAICRVSVGLLAGVVEYVVELHQQVQAARMLLKCKLEK